MNEDGVICIGGRFQNAHIAWASKHPIILPSKNNDAPDTRVPREVLVLVDPTHISRTTQDLLDAAWQASHQENREKMRLVQTSGRKNRTTRYCSPAILQNSTRPPPVLLMWRRLLRPDRIHVVSSPSEALGLFVYVHSHSGRALGNGIHQTVVLRPVKVQRLAGFLRSFIVLHRCSNIGDETSE